jgi:hypothetical protein
MLDIDCKVFEVSDCEFQSHFKLSLNFGTQGHRSPFRCIITLLSGYFYRDLIKKKPPSNVPYLVQFGLKFSIRVLLLSGEAILAGGRVSDVLGVGEFGHRLATRHVGLEDGLQLEELVGGRLRPVVEPPFHSTRGTRPSVTRVAHRRTLKLISN